MEVEFYLLAISLLFFASIFSDRIGNKYGIPALLIFLQVGMFFGPEGLGLTFDSIGAAQALGTVALCVILFTGGMDTKIQNVRLVLGPGIMLSTLGVLITTLVTAGAVYGMFSWFDMLVKLSIPMALLLASAMSSTDSASVFSILRTQGISLKHNIRQTLELESGANDPMAFILVSTMIGVVTSNMDGAEFHIDWLMIVQDIFIQMIMGLAIGFIAGRALLWIMRKVMLTNESLYPIMILSACIFIFSVSYYMKGNSFLAVYVGGLIIGNSKFTRKRQTRSFFDGLTWLCQLAMFLMLGLMVRPRDFLDMHVIVPCLLITLAMMFIARPIAVYACMYPFRDKYDWRDNLLISWVGLKGAVPIIFAIQCQAAGVPYSNMIFNVIFLCTLLSLMIQGTTIGYVAKKLNLATASPKLHKLYHFDMDLPEEIESSATEIVITERLMRKGNMLKDLSLPKKTLAIMVRRQENFFVPTGMTELQEGDILLVITDNGVALAQQLMEMDMEDQKRWDSMLLQHPGELIRQTAKKFMEAEHIPGLKKEETMKASAGIEMEHHAVEEENASEPKEKRKRKARAENEDSESNHEEEKTEASEPQSHELELTFE